MSLLQCSQIVSLNSQNERWLDLHLREVHFLPVNSLQNQRLSWLLQFVLMDPKSSICVLRVPAVQLLLRNEVVFNLLSHVESRLWKCDGNYLRQQRSADIMYHLLRLLKWESERLGCDDALLTPCHHFREPPSFSLRLGLPSEWSQRTILKTLLYSFCIFISGK